MRSTPDEPSTRARILSAALLRVAEDGVAGATVRSIAAAADVSPGLVIHHFGSKRGLLDACDHHVRTTIVEGKEKALAEGTQIDAMQALRMAGDRLPVMRYLARVLASGGPQADRLFDEIVVDAMGYVQRSIDDGLMRPTDDLHATVTVLTTWQLGAMVLHEHVARHLGADLTGDLAGIAAWMIPAGRLLAEGALTDQGAVMVDRMVQAMSADGAPHRRHEPADPESPDPPGA